MAEAVRAVLEKPGRLEAMSRAARGVALPEAASRLADLVESTAG